jgi:hypothetical protein
MRFLLKEENLKFGIETLRWAALSRSLYIKKATYGLIYHMLVLVESVGCEKS